MEEQPWLALAHVLAVTLGGKLLEPLWGSAEMLTFFCLVNAAAACLGALVHVLLYALTGEPRHLFGVHLRGPAAFCAGVAVAVKQLMPDHVLLATPLVKLRNRHVAPALPVLALILYVVHLLDGTRVVLCFLGLLVAWVYLRFCQRHGNGTRGDLADSFSFASFFPNVMQPPVAVVSNTFFEFMVRIKVCQKPIRKYNIASASSITVSMPGTDLQDAERRRQIALRALNERLNKSDQTSWPSMVDDDDPKNVMTDEERGKHVSIAIPPTHVHEAAHVPATPVATPATSIPIIQNDTLPVVQTAPAPPTS